MSVQTERTAAGMEARLATAREAIGVQLATARADDSSFSRGVVAGLQEALRRLDWAFGADQDWMHEAMRP